MAVAVAAARDAAPQTLGQSTGAYYTVAVGPVCLVAHPNACMADEKAKKMGLKSAFCGGVFFREYGPPPYFGEDPISGSRVDYGYENARTLQRR